MGYDNVVNILYDIIISESFIFFYVSDDYITVTVIVITVIYDIIL